MGARIEDKVVFSHLGPILRENIVPQLADSCLQVEGVDWSVVSGVVDANVIVSARKAGFVQKPRTVVKSRSARSARPGRPTGRTASSRTGS